MEWDCFCRYPAFSNGPDCGVINPNVCSGGKFDWNKKQLPTEASCTCDPNTQTELRDYRGVPYCVPKEFEKWYTNYFTMEGNLI